LSEKAVDKAVKDYCKRLHGVAVCQPTVEILNIIVTIRVTDTNCYI